MVLFSMVTNDGLAKRLRVPEYKWLRGVFLKPQTGVELCTYAVRSLL